MFQSQSFLCKSLSGGVSINIHIQALSTDWENVQQPHLQKEDGFLRVIMFALTRKRHKTYKGRVQSQQWHCWPVIKPMKWKTNIGTGSNVSMPPHGWTHWLMNICFFSSTLADSPEEWLYDFELPSYKYTVKLTLHVNICTCEVGSNVCRRFSCYSNPTCWFRTFHHQINGHVGMAPDQYSMHQLCMIVRGDLTRILYFFRFFLAMKYKPKSVGTLP